MQQVYLELINNISQPIFFFFFFENTMYLSGTTIMQMPKKATI